MVKEDELHPIQPFDDLGAPVDTLPSKQPFLFTVEGGAAIVVELAA